MMIDLKNAVSALSTLIADEKTLLIKFGEREESLYYQAALGPARSSEAITVYFHATSQILERLRLQGTLAVIAQSATGTTCYASLMQGPADGKTECSAMLVVHDRCDDLVSAPRFLPLT